MKNNLKKTDPQAFQIIQDELARQENGLEMIPSENFVSTAVLEAMGSILTNKYSEGYSGKRYYGGNEHIDKLETLAIERAKKLFGVSHVNVQPYSGSPANLAVYLATCNPGDKIMGLNLVDGGHLTHGWKVSATGIFYESIPYHVKEDGYLDFEEIRALALEHKPKLIWCGATAYPRELDFEKFAEIADEVGAYLVADIAHIAGLIAAGAHQSPTEHVHIITTTTHKTLRGPRGAMIMTTQKGLTKDADLAKKIDRAVFPGLQGGPHNHTTAGIAVMLQEAVSDEFKAYGHQVVTNAKALAKGLKNEGIELVTDGTDNHLLLIDLTPFGNGKGIFVQEALDLASITTNKNTIPGEPASPFYPSGIRLGTPALTSRKMMETEMEIIAKWISEIIHETKNYKIDLGDKDVRKKQLEDFRKEIKDNKTILDIKKKVVELTNDFPLYLNLKA